MSLIAWSVESKFPAQETLLADLPRQIIQTDNTILELDYETKSNSVQIDILILCESDQCIAVEIVPEWQSPPCSA